MPLAEPPDDLPDGRGIAAFLPDWQRIEEGDQVAEAWSLEEAEAGDEVELTVVYGQTDNRRIEKGLVVGDQENGTGCRHAAGAVGAVFVEQRGENGGEQAPNFV
jgi:hypothetical protein